MEKLLKVDIIGQGNVAFHLAKALGDKADVESVNSHTLAEKRKDAHITLIAVADSAIEEVASRLGDVRGVVAHTSGSTSAEVLSKFDEFGVFYPLQTFSRNISLDYDEIPFFTEGNSPQCEELLRRLALLISPTVRHADSGQRKAMHIAAVFACNFANHLWAIADSLLADNGMEFDLLRPLVKETLRKTELHSPAECQTGPAARGDLGIIREHEASLSTMPQIQQIYHLLSESIAHNYYKE